MTDTQRPEDSVREELIAGHPVDDGNPPYCDGCHDYAPKDGYCRTLTEALEALASLTTRLEQAEGALRQIVTLDHHKWDGDCWRIAHYALSTGEPSKETIRVPGDYPTVTDALDAHLGEPSKGER